MQPETEKTEAAFARLAEQWKTETYYHSNSYIIVNHPAYQEIISMGELALPLIFREMEAHGGHWYHALRAITGANPVPESARGRVREIQAIWLQWGREHGYEWDE